MQDPRTVLYKPMASSEFTNEAALNGVDFCICDMYLSRIYIIRKKQTKGNRGKKRSMMTVKPCGCLMFLFIFY
jgi:hypothetical protein